MSKKYSMNSKEAEMQDQHSNKERNHISIFRVSSGKYGCPGVALDHELVPFAVTLENEETLIPEGTHPAHRTLYHKGGYATFEIIVDGRSRILFHKLNKDVESMGCIGIAEKFEKLNGEFAILESQKGFQEFMGKYGSFDNLVVHIKNCF